MAKPYFIRASYIQLMKDRIVAKTGDRSHKLIGPISDHDHLNFTLAGPLLQYERLSWFTRLPRKLSMVTNITRVFDQLSWILIFIVTFFGFLFLLVIVPISQSYGAKVTAWNGDYISPLEMQPKEVSLNEITGYLGGRKFLETEYYMY